MDTIPKLYFEEFQSQQSENTYARRRGGGGRRRSGGGRRWSGRRGSGRRSWGRRRWYGRRYSPRVYVTSYGYYPYQNYAPFAPGYVTNYPCYTNIDCPTSTYCQNGRCVKPAQIYY